MNSPIPSQITRGVRNTGSYGLYLECRDTHSDDDGFVREGAQVPSKLEVAPVVGEQHGVAHRRQRIDALDEGFLLDALVGCPIQQIAPLRGNSK